MLSNLKTCQVPLPSTSRTAQKAEAAFSDTTQRLNSPGMCCPPFLFSVGQLWGLQGMDGTLC